MSPTQSVLKYPYPYLTSPHLTRLVRDLLTFQKKKPGRARS